MFKHVAQASPFKSSRSSFLALCLVSFVYTIAGLATVGLVGLDEGGLGRGLK